MPTGRSDLDRFVLLSGEGHLRYVDADESTRERCGFHGQVGPADPSDMPVGRVQDPHTRQDISAPPTTSRTGVTVPRGTFRVETHV